MIVKILSTTVGETGADYLAVHVGFGQAVTDVCTLIPLTVALGQPGLLEKHRDLVAFGVVE